jgi:NDP-sugar pyrophosphorylase family protein
LTLGRLRQPSKRRRQEFEPSIHELLRSERIQTCNALDTGLFVCAPALFAALDVSTASEDTTLSGGIRQLAVRGLVRAFEIGDASWYDIDTIADLQAAESRLTIHERGQRCSTFHATLRSPSNRAHVSPDCRLPNGSFVRRFGRVTRGSSSGRQTSVQP